MKKIIFSLIFLATVFLPFNSASAAYFGGRLTGTFFCNCSGTLLLFIQDYASGGSLRLVYGPGSKLLSGSPTGLYQLGTYGGAGVCLIYSGDSCKSISNNGIIGGPNPGFGTS